LKLWPRAKANLWVDSVCPDPEDTNLAKRSLFSVTLNGTVHNSTRALALLHPGSLPAGPWWI
jgi:hypothetical protein